MLELPQKYIHALEEVLSIKLSENALIKKGPNRQKLERIARSVTDLSQGLTKDHSAFTVSRYLSDRDMRTAYLLYYMSTNLLKLWPPLRELEAGGFFAGRRSIKHLDIGSGTGTAVWSALLFVEEYLKEVEAVEFYLTDLVEQNLTSAREFFRHLQPWPFRVLPDYSGIDAKKITRGTKEFDELQAKGPFDIITLMNVVNELDTEGEAERIDTLLSLLKEDGSIIMIEPSAKEQSRRALQFRDALVERGAFVYSPCTRTGGCPALQHTDDWCHTEVAWDRPAFIAFIDDLAGTLRLSLKSTYGVFLKRDQNLSDHFLAKRDFYNSGRIVSDIFREKGRSRGFICNEYGRWEYVQNKRDRGEGNKRFADAERYDLVAMNGIEQREHDRKVGEGATFHTLMSSEGARAVDNLNASEKK